MMPDPQNIGHPFVETEHLHLGAKGHQIPLDMVLGHEPNPARDMRLKSLAILFKAGWEVKHFGKVRKLDSPSHNLPTLKAAANMFLHSNMHLRCEEIRKLFLSKVCEAQLSHFPPAFSKIFTV